MQAARAVGVRPSFEVLLEADMVHEEEATEENRIHMRFAMKEAVRPQPGSLGLREVRRGR